MANIVAATIRLLQTKSPQDLTLKDIAEESGHGNRLIVEWFGGKGGLFVAVFQEIFQNLLETGDLFAADVPVRHEVRGAFRLFNYMFTNHPEVIASNREGLVFAGALERLQSRAALSEEEATRILRRLTVLILGISLFGELFQLEDDEAIRMMQDEFRLSAGYELPAHAPEV
jgi:AcrR family transcriptional regulator